MSDVELQLNGEPFTHWTDLSVGLSMEHIATSFQHGLLLPLAAGVLPDTMQPAKGMHARLLLEGEPVADGYVFGDSRSFDANTFRVSLSGASRAADLVDCDPVDQAEIFRDMGLRAIVTKLLADYLLDGEPIPTRFDAPEGEPFHKFAIEQGETVFAVIERAARQRGLLVMSDTDGTLIFTRLAETTPVDSLDVGINIVSGTSERDDRDVFSAYYFYGQTSASDTHFAKSASNLKGVVIDPRMARYRPRVGLEGQSNRETPKERATWESNTRYGRSERHVYVVDGWRGPTSGKLWTPNTLVHVQDPLQHVYGGQLLCSVRFGLSEEAGKRTELEVCAPEAFTLEAA